jgi:hypothetical protein
MGPLEPVQSCYLQNPASMLPFKFSKYYGSKEVSQSLILQHTRKKSKHKILFAKKHQ